MAMINKDYKRKIRINCLPDRFDGRGVDVVDAKTGEPIRNILSMVIHLDALGTNTCEITYHEMDGKDFQIDDEGHVRILDEPKESTITVKDVEIDDLTAFEIMDNIRKERNEA
jgi:hypothetical protein